MWERAEHFSVVEERMKELVVVLAVLALLSLGVIAGAIAWHIESTRRHGKGSQVPDPACPKGTRNARPAHFRMSPLSVWTPDNRNAQYFKNGKYGVRFSWISIGTTAPVAPSAGVCVDGATYKWEIHNAEYDTQGKAEGAWEPARFSTMRASLDPGRHSVTVGGFEYTCTVPGCARDTTLSGAMFVGDVNTNGVPGYEGTETVLRSFLTHYSEKVSIVFFVGDIFYRNDPFIQSVWQDWTDDDGILDRLVMAVPGNHDYDAGGCNGCQFCKDGVCGCSCSTPEATAAWVPYFFASDGVLPFHTHVTRATAKCPGQRGGCRVPLEHTLQFVALGDSVIVTVDNTYSVSEISEALGLNGWTSAAKALRDKGFKNIVLAGHWDGLNLGSESMMQDVLATLGKPFTDAGLRVSANLNHTHTNTAVSGPDGGKVWTAGNGYCNAGCGCACGSPCSGCECCCPSLLHSGQWLLGGWSKDRACFPLADDHAQEIIGGELSDITSRQLQALNAGAHVPLSEDELLEFLTPFMFTDDAVVASLDGGAPGEVLIPIQLKSMPHELTSNPALFQRWREKYGIYNGYPHCDKISASSSSWPALACWNKGKKPWELYDVGPGLCPVASNDELCGRDGD